MKKNDNIHDPQDVNTIDVVCQIKNKFSLLPASHKKIAQYLIDNPESLNNCSITQFARKVKSAPSTITRFCQALNFSGFSEFKFSLEKGTQNPIYEEPISPHESITSIKKKLHTKYIQSINETIMLLNERELKYAAEAIIGAEKVIFFAHGGSGIVSQFAQISFMQIGIPCSFFNDTLLAQIGSAQVTRNDVVIGISYSGSAVTSVDALRTGKQNGATTIGISGYANSLLMRYADIKLCYNATINDDLRYHHIARMCETSIIGILQTYILSRYYEKLQKHTHISKNAFMRGRYR